MPVLVVVCRPPFFLHPRCLRGPGLYIGEMPCVITPSKRRRARAAMALSKLSADEQSIILGQLCNALEPRLAVYFS